MPYDIDINTNTPKISFVISSTVELVCAVQLLAKPSHHEFAHDFSQTIIKDLSQDSIELLEEIGDFQFHGLELFEYILDNRAFSNPKEFINHMINYSEEEFIYLLTSEIIDANLLNKIRNQQTLTQNETEKIAWLYKEDISEIKNILFDTARFKDSYIQLLTEIADSSAFQKVLSNQQLNYEDTIKNLKEKLKSRTPLELGQDLMGKVFRTVYNYQEYIFCPSYFLSPHRLRVHHEKTNLVIYDMRRDVTYLSEIGKEITNTLKIISDRTRIEILRRLSMGRSYGKALANNLDLTTATISHHLDQLKSIGLIQEEKVKNTKYFSVDQQKLTELLELTSQYLNNKI